MGEWAYKAKDIKGKYREGVLSANSKAEAQKQIREMKLRLVYVKEKKDGPFSNLMVKDRKGKTHLILGSGMPGTKDLAVFTKQFSIMIERGVSLIQALSILAEQQKLPVFANVIDKVRVMVENGATLSSAMANFPKAFDDLYVAMIRSGEMSGNLDIVLREIVKFLEKSAKLKKQIRSASIYPSMICFVAATITYGILVFLVPVFAEQYASMGQELPALTQFVVDLSDFLRNSMLIIIAIIVGAVMGFTQYRKTPKGRLAIDSLMLSLPVISEVVRKVAIGRFTATLSTMMSSGVSILDALTICSQSSGNKLIEQFVNNVKDKISQGSTFSQPLAEGNLFPNMVISMVAVGEQTGALDETLAKVSEIYEEEVDTAVKNMTDMMQPIMIISIGLILGTVVIALYLPIMDQANLVGG
jgi:type IV pilus assembly protein PilC